MTVMPLMRATDVVLSLALAIAALAHSGCSASAPVAQVNYGLAYWGQDAVCVIGSVESNKEIPGVQMRVEKCENADLRTVCFAKPSAVTKWLAQWPEPSKRFVILPLENLDPAADDPSKGILNDVLWLARVNSRDTHGLYLIILISKDQAFRHNEIRRSLTVDAGMIDDTRDFYRRFPEKMKAFTEAMERLSVESPSVTR